MDKFDKRVGITFKVTVVLYVLVIASRRIFHLNVYEMVSLPLGVFLGLILAYIGVRWGLNNLGFFQRGSTKVSRKAVVNLFGAVTVFILFGTAIEILCHNLSLTQQATADLQASTDGRVALGDPIRLGWFISGSMRSGVASFSIPVKGSKAAGKLEVRGAREDGSWRIVELYLIMDGNRAVVHITH
jgi:hypothetical protein